MLLIERVTLVKGDIKESITKVPVAVEGLTPEEFKANVMALFRCDRVLLTYTVKEEEEEDDENKD